MRCKYAKVATVALATLAVVALAATPALADNECFDYTVSSHLIDIAKSPGALESYISHNVSKDGRRIKVGRNASTGYKAALYMDFIATLGSKISTAQKLFQMVWDGGSCVSVSFEVASVNLYWPVIYDACGPSASISGGLHVGGEWQQDSNANWHFMPVIYDYFDGELALQCGYTCFRVYGGIHAHAETGFEPTDYCTVYGSLGIQAYASATVNPNAGAEVLCISDTWEWDQYGYSGKKVTAVVYFD